MASRKRRKKKKELIKVDKSILNTTIRTDVLNEFKIKCKDIGCPMNFVLETFMEQFSKDYFKLRIGVGQLKYINEDIADEDRPKLDLK